MAGVIRNSEDSTRAVAPDVIPAVSRSRSIDKIREKDTLSDGEQSQSIARGVRAPVPGGYAFNSAQVIVILPSTIACRLDKHIDRYVLTVVILQAFMSQSRSAVQCSKVNVWHWSM